MDENSLNIKDIIGKIKAEFESECGSPLDMKLCEDKMCFGTPDDIVIEG